MIGRRHNFRLEPLEGCGPGTSRVALSITVSVMTFLAILGNRVATVAFLTHGRPSNPGDAKSIFYWRIFDKDADRRLAHAIRTGIGNHLQEMYSHPPPEN